MIFGSYAPSLINFRGPLIAALAAKCHEVVAVAPDIDQATAEGLRKLGAEPREFQVTNQSVNPMALLAAVREFRRLLKEEEPDVLISYTIKPVVVGALAGKAARVRKIISFITGAGYAFTGGREAKRQISRIAASLLYRMALRRSDCVVFQNGDDERMFRRLGLVSRRQNVRRVDGSGVDLAQFAPAPLPRNTSFLIVSRLLKDKGIREFAAAAARVKSAYPDVPVRLVGYIDGSPDSISESDLERMIDSGVEFEGRLADVRPAIAQCSVYVLPSYREGTPRSVLEAMAMGRAIITTDAPGCRETVVEGENGFLVPPRDADSLFRAMVRFIEDDGLADRMGSRSRQIAERKFDVRKVNADLMEIAGL